VRLAGLLGGSGWAAAWTDPSAGSSSISAGTLSLGELVTLGNRASLQGPSSFLTRPLAQPLGQTGSTIYLSFLVRPVAGVSGVNAWGGFNLGPSAGGNSLFVGKGGAYLQYALETAGGTGIATSRTTAVEGQTALLVVRILFGAGADTIDLWVNPPSGASAPPVPDATKTDLDLGTADQVAINTGDNLVVDLDELRIGPTYVSVTPQTCYANCDQSTQPPALNIADFICFLSKFAGADPYANCDASTTPPTLNVADFICFQSAFAAGCP